MKSSRVPGLVAAIALSSLLLTSCDSSTEPVDPNACTRVRLDEIGCARVEGKVIDTSGQPVPDADVYAHFPETLPPFGYVADPVETDAVGDFSLLLIQLPTAVGQSSRVTVFILAELPPNSVDSVEVTVEFVKIGEVPPIASAEIVLPEQ